MFDAAVTYFCSTSVTPEAIEGVSEIGRSDRTPGTMWAYDGRTVLKRGIDEKVIVDQEEGIGKTVSVPTIESLVDLVGKNPDNDVVYFINTKDHLATPVKGGLRNYDDHVKIRDLCAQLPDDFVSYDAGVPKNQCGSRTRAAMLSAYLLNNPPLSDGSEVRVVIAKETMYGNTEHGKVAEFGVKGYLCREFFVMKDECHAGPFVDEEQKLVGVVREYEPRNGMAALKSESYVTLTPQGVSYTPALQRAA